MDNSFQQNKHFGFFLLARSLYLDDLWTLKPAWWLKVWIYIIGKVNHANHSKKLPRGSGLFTYREIYEACNLKEEGIKIRTIDNTIRSLRLNRKIASQKTTRGIIITVLNYAQYQDISAYMDELKNDTKNDTGTTQERHDKQRMIKNESVWAGNNTHTNSFSSSIERQKKTASPDDVTPEVIARIAAENNVLVEDVQNISFAAFKRHIKINNPIKHDFVAYFELWVSGDIEKGKLKKKMSLAQQIEEQEGIKVY